MPGSVYGQSSGSSGSVYAQRGSSGGSAYSGKGGGGTKAPHHTGGILGAVEHVVQPVAHVVGKTAGGLASDAYHLPGGLYDLGKAGSHDAALLFGRLGLAPRSSYAYKQAHGPNARSELLPIAKGTALGFKESFQHPLRHPDQTLINLLSVASLGAGTAARLGAAADAVRAGDLAGTARALAVKAPTEPRIFTVGEKNHFLQPSENHLMRAAQAVHDRVVMQRGLSDPEARLSRYANWRLRNADRETLRYQHALRESHATPLERFGKHLDPVEQRALQLTSQNTTTREMLRMYEGHGKLSAQQTKEVGLLKQIDKRGLLTQDHEGNVIVDPVKAPRLAAVDELLASGAAMRDEIAKQTGEMTQEGLTERINAPGKIVAGAHYEKPTPAKMGELSKSHQRFRAYAAELEKRHESALAKAAKKGVPYPDVTVKVPGVDRIVTKEMSRGEAESRLAELDKKYEAAVKKIEPMVDPYQGRSATEYGRSAKQTEQRYRNMKSGKGGSGSRYFEKEKSVSQEVRQLAERRLDELVAKHPEQQFAKDIAERDRLREAINEAQLHDLGPGENGAPPSFGKVTKTVKGKPGTKTIPSDMPPAGVLSNPAVTHYGAALSVVRDRLERMDAAAARREKPTGIVGANGARPGRNYVSARVYESRNGTAPVARAGGEILGAPRKIVGAHAYTGEALEAGMNPTSVTETSARSIRAALKKLNTLEYRGGLAKAGSDVRRTGHDVLVNTGELKNAKVPDRIQAALGRKLDNTAEVRERAALEGIREAIFGTPHGMTDEEIRNAPVGTEAPKGYKWVDRRLIGEEYLNPMDLGRGKGTRVADWLNSFQTLFTVYLKPAHVLTRVSTNAFTNLIQGSLRPTAVMRAIKMRQALSDEDYIRTAAASGQPASAALFRGEGESRMVNAARRGSHFWTHFDLPFRFNSLVHEAYRAGIRTPEAFHQLLDDAEHVHDLPAGRAAVVDRVMKRADREAIAYDRLSPFEKNKVARYLWFYPWTSGATRFLGNTILEHPVKAAVGAAVGAEGARTQASQLGELPSYAQSLFAIGGNPGQRTVINAGTLTPFETPAQVLSAVAAINHPKSSEQTLAGYLSPAMSALGRAAYNVDEFGQPNRKHTALGNLLEGLLSTTPEYEIEQALTGKKGGKPTMYAPEPSALDALLLAALGSARPRKVNTSVAHQRAGQEKSGR